MGSVFILGPAVDGVIEPVATAATPAASTGRQMVAFDDPATAPGGNVFLKMLPKVAPTDLVPTNIYAFHVPQPSVPAVADRTTDWFFKSGNPSASVHSGTADPATGKLKITVPGVKPSLVPYHVQTILEFSS